MVFVEAPTTEQQIADIAKRLPGYKLINMFHGGKTPLVAVPKLQEFGYHVVIIPSDTQRAAIRAMQRVLATIARDGSAAAMIDDMASFKEREAIIGTDELHRPRQEVRVMSHGPSADNPQTRGIADFVAGLAYEQIPAEVIARIKLLILDFARLRHVRHRPAVEPKSC